MAEWIALSDRPEPAQPPENGVLLEKASLILEVSLPLKCGAVLLDYRRTQDWLRAFSVFHDPVAGVGILHRQGGSVVRHMLAGPLPGDTGTARIVFSWDAPKRLWVLRYELLELGQVLTAQGLNPMPLPLDDLVALCAGGGESQRHPGLLWFGVTLGEAPPERAPWLGLRTPIATPRGYVMAGHLRAGDLVLTRNAGVRALASVRRHDLPSRGSFAPVLLRAPYFAAQTDLLVSADQLIALSGVEVEYLFGEEEVLAEARHLTDGWSAIHDRRRAVTACVSLDIGAPDLIIGAGCVLAGAQHDVAPADRHQVRRVLRSYEAVPLLALLGRGNRNRAA
ncbi:MAG: Hint domain-containing protein [Paracoccaceae bacterium]|nr:Hint domain-containing protein [Paracoccaceae bacterium]